MRVIQEKFEKRSTDVQGDGQNKWASARSARVKKGTPGREGRPEGDGASRFVNNAVFYGSLPPGMDIEDQEMADHRVFNESTAGNFARGHNAGDFSQELDARALKQGFTRKSMRPTDDERYNEHQDTFYNTVTDEDGRESFVERGNVLDRS